MNDLRNTLRNSYDRIAAEFAVTNAVIPPAVLSSVQEFLTRIEPACRILDVGCGHGRESALFASLDYRVVAFDLSRNMLCETGKVLGQPRVQGDMTRLPFHMHSFDALWCNAAFLHIPKALAHTCLTDFRRALCPEGVLFLALQAGSGEVWEPQSYGVEAPRFFARYCLGEAAQLIEAAGFQIVTQSENRQGPRAYWLHFIARL
jgi:SAM-dependent methyltransferase